MKKSLLFPATALCALALAGGAAAPAAQGYRVIVAAGSPVATLKRDAVARIFLRKLTRWQDGREIAPVDQSARAAVRAAFSKDVLSSEGLGKISAVENYWRQQIYSGRGVPPPVKASDADVLGFVASTPGAIGYVSENADLTGVKPVVVED